MATSEGVERGKNLEGRKWPSDFAGRNLFERGPDWRNNAMLGWTGFPMGLYAAGYKDAADAILYALSQQKASLDSVVYPLVFVYRQGIELQLKMLLPLARRLAGKAPKNDHSHGLMPMWSQLRPLLEELTPREDDAELPAIESFIEQIDKVDPQSFSFRYPTTKRGSESLPDLRQINVRQLSEIMDSIFRMLGGIHSELGEMDQVGEGFEF